MERPNFKRPCPECDKEFGHTKECQEGVKRRAAVREWWKSLGDIPPCEFCGRVVLAGVCCQKRLDKAIAERKHKKK